MYLLLSYLFRNSPTQIIVFLSPLVLRNAFNAFDPEKNGYINTAMVGTILSMLGHQLDDATLAEIIAEVDEDGSGQIEFEEFTTLAARFLVEEDAEAMMAELKEAFRLYDKEGNGYITTGVLREILRELDDKLTNDDLDMMIEEIDSDGSGTVDFDGKTVQFFINQTKYLFVIFSYRIYGSYDWWRRLNSCYCHISLGSNSFTLFTTVYWLPSSIQS